jgi:hypothetical protein
MRNNKTTLEKLLEDLDEFMDEINRQVERAEDRLSQAKDTYFDNRESDDLDSLIKAFKARGKADELRYLLSDSLGLKKLQQDKNKLNRLYNKLERKLQEFDEGEENSNAN